MALEDLIPKLKVCFTECGEVTLTDVTGIYHVTTNPGGWDNTATVLPEDIDNAVVKYKHSSQDTYTELDVIQAIDDQGAGAESSFLLDYITVTQGDGLYHFIYEVSQVSGERLTTMSAEVYVYNLCSVRCCIDKLWVKVASEVSLDSDCGCVETSMTKATKAEGYYQALLSLGSCGNTTTADAILEKLQTLCTKENCNCN